jgi:glycosyltransferase involved in cell wall biosynthesis
LGFFQPLIRILNIYFVSQLPYLSIIIPARNEEKYIYSVLESVKAQNYPSEHYEIIIADGCSDDQTRRRIDDFMRDHPGMRIIVVENEQKIVPFALNKSIKKAVGNVIVRLDAHSVYPTDYLSRLVNGLKEHNADNIGGVFNTLPHDESHLSISIAFAMSHPLGVGDSLHRIGGTKVREVDSVPYGCFKKEVFDRIGLFDEELVRNQDDEFNGRMKKAGMKVLMLPDLKIDYYARESLVKLFRMFYQYGLFKPLAVSKLRQIPSFRQLVPPGLVVYLFAGFILPFLRAEVSIIYGILLGIYLLMIFGVALNYSIKSSLKRFPLVVSAFIIMHFSYGLGYLKGLWGLLSGNKKVFQISGTSR